VTPWLERVRAALAPQGYDVERELESGGIARIVRDMIQRDMVTPGQRQRLLAAAAAQGR